MDWIWQNLLSSVIWEILLIIGGAAGLAYLRAKWPQWAAPVLYAVGGAACIAVVLFTATGHSILSHQQPETTIDNVEANVKVCLDNFDYSIRKGNDPDSFFTIEAEDRGGRIIAI
jgi:hypothetical protein